MSLPFGFSRHSMACLLAATVGVAGFAAFAVADAVVYNPNPIDRKFPQGVFCPIPIDVAFQSISSEIDIHFSAEVYTQIGPGLERANQSLDNVVLVTEAAYLANQGPLPSQAEFCYNGALLTSTLHFQNVAPGDIKLLELFNDDPTPRGWDMANGGFFQPTYTAVRNPGDDQSATNSGSLGLGYDSPNPSLGDLATTRIHVGGLTPGQNYRMVAWWDVLDFSQEGVVTLTISITAPDATPVAKKTWGATKRAYR